MKTPLIIVTLALILIVGGVIFYSFFQKSASENNLPNTPNELQSVTLSTNPTLQIDSSRYHEFSKAAFDQAANTKRVLFFYANWCPTCRPADASFKANESQIPNDVVVIRVNYNDDQTDQEEKDLARKYGVTYQHTFVQIDPQGNQVTKWNGGQIEELLSNLK